MGADDYMTTLGIEELLRGSRHGGRTRPADAVTGCPFPSSRSSTSILRLCAFPAYPPLRVEEVALPPTEFALLRERWLNHPLVKLGPSHTFFACPGARVRADTSTSGCISGGCGQARAARRAGRVITQPRAG